MDVGADITAVLRMLGLRARTARTITGIPSVTSQRATVCVRLTNGRQVKVRRMATPRRAQDYGSLIRALPHLPLPALLARYKNLTVEEWMQGTPLNRLTPTRARLAAAADILSTVHETDRIGVRLLRAHAATRPLVTLTKRRINRLAAAGMLSTPVARQLIEAVRRCAPKRAAAGLIHTDFCAENIIEDRRGRLFVIDNTGLQWGFLDYDLARTWYRWSLPAAARRIFLTRYRSRHPRPPVGSAVYFWRIAAVAKSAHFRWVHGGHAVESPMGHLLRLSRAAPPPTPRKLTSTRGAR